MDVVAERGWTKATTEEITKMSFVASACLCIKQMTYKQQERDGGEMERDSRRRDAERAILAGKIWFQYRPFLLSLFSVTSSFIIQHFFSISFYTAGENSVYRACQKPSQAVRRSMKLDYLEFLKRHSHFDLDTAPLTSRRALRALVFKRLLRIKKLQSEDAQGDVG